MDLEDQLPSKKSKTRSEIGKANKRSGKSGERKCADYLTLITESSWQRIPNSGAFLGRANRKRIAELSKGQIVASTGDIFPPDGLKYKIIIECKNYSSLSFKKLEKNQTPANLKGWTEELLYDCATSLMDKHDDRKHIGFLYINIKRQKEMLGINPEYLKSLRIKYKSFLLYTYEVKSDIDGYGNKWELHNFKDFVKENKEIFK